MNWLQIVAGLIGLLTAFVTWLQDRGKLEQTEAIIIVQNLKKEQERVQQAIDARNAVKSDPDSLRNDPNNRHK